jgi:hypothetical protein
MSACEGRILMIPRAKGIRQVFGNFYKRLHFRDKTNDSFVHTFPGQSIFLEVVAKRPSQFLHGNSVLRPKETFQIKITEIPKNCWPAAPYLVAEEQLGDFKQSLSLSQ